MEKEVIGFKVGAEDEGERLDKFLVARLSEKRSRSFLQRLISEGHVLVNGLAVKSHHRMKDGESIEISIPEPASPVARPEEIPLDVLYEDKHIIVVNKSADMVVHPAPGNYTGTLVNALLARCADLSGIGGILKPGIVHRLDKGTSGILVAAKTDEAHGALAGQFKARTIRRVYAALVRGVVQLDNGKIELPIGRSPKDRKKMAVNFVKSRTAITTYRVSERFKDCTLVELSLGTGRTHQIRVHMSHIGHPLLGDDKYGSRGKLKRPMLHAKTLGFAHPVTGKYMEFTSDLPQDMQDAIKAARAG